jgi:hypothetical protein
MCRRPIFLISFVWLLCSITNAPANLVGHWPFEGNFNDSSGNGNDATARGNAAIVNDTQRGQVTVLDGTGDYLEIAHSNSLNITGDQISLAAWVYFDDVSGSPEIIIAKVFNNGTHTSPYFSYGLHILTNGQPRFWLSLSGGAANVPAPAGQFFQSRQWYHLAGVYEGSAMTLYVNGQAVATTSVRGAINGYSNVLRLGTNGGLTEQMSGKLDDVRIYSRAMSPEQVLALFNGTAPTWVQAHDPIPADGALHSDTWVNLSWSPGDNAVSHDVYLGNSFEDVNNGTGGTFRGNQTSTYFVAGFPGFAYPDGLVYGTTYYWRIDEVEAGGTKHKGDVWSFTVPPKKAYDPAPADGAKFIDPKATTLSWTPGLGAKLHHVYFGENPADVEAGTPGTYKGASATAKFDPGTLALETTYYWRVDEFDGTATHKGDVWSFTTTLPGLGAAVAERWLNISGTNLNTLKNDARYPNNPDVTEAVTKFAWDGPDTDSYGGRIHGWLYVPATGDYTFWLNTDDQGELWLSTDDDSSNVRLIARESTYTAINAWGTGEEQSQPIPLAGGQKYYIMALWKEGTGGDHCQVAWQGPTVPARTVIPGSNLSPYEPLKAYGAKPANGATGVTQTPVLEWKPGLAAASHEVYFGTDAQAVASATKASAEYKGAKALGNESYSPGKLAWETAYYWRIDEVNNTNPAGPWIGSVWSFTTAGFLIIDDFESYNAGANQIWYSWHDGLGYGAPGSPPYFAGNGTGSAVGDENTASFTEETIIHGGRQSMPVAYDNNKQGFAKYSEAELTLTAPRDWTEESVAELSIWFRGLPGSVGSFVEAPAGTYTITATGADIWGTADQFHYGFKTLTGVGSIEAQVLSVGNTDPWAKAGVMIRETLDAGSKFAAVYITPGNGCRFQARTDTGIAATSDTAVVTPAQTAIKAPYWVKLERDVAGDFRGYYSNNRTTWTAMSWNPQSIVMGSDVYVGLALTSHNANATCTAKFSNVRTTGTVSAQWAHQDIGIASNAAEPLYVAVSNSAGQPAVVVHSDTNAATITTWTEWVIPLQSFADKGINLKNVDRLAIGLGTRSNMTTAGGSGKMYFDDIRLYRPRTAP